MSDWDDEQEHEEDDSGSEDEFSGVYVVDEDTARLLEVVVGMIHMLGDTQVDENARENCHIIAQELADRFGVVEDSMEVEEIIHGDEILYKPKGGVFGDEPVDEEPEADTDAQE